jgi:hypothetical protein
MGTSDVMLVVVGTVMGLIGVMNASTGEEQGGSAVIFFVIAGICFAMAFREMVAH